MHELKSGSRLANRYTLVRKLGAGGGAQVWLADDSTTGQSVALKILVDQTLEPGRLRREWQHGIRLMHAHIVRVFEFYDISEASERAFFSLQFIDGPGIEALSGAPVEDILAPAALLADALRYAHAKGIVHRDIKASNVLLDTNGAPYLIDFGVAAARFEPASGGSLIAASPQSLAGEPAQAADDIFALGGLLYELLTGQSPYSSDDTANDIRSRIPMPILNAAGQVAPEAVSKLVAAMLHKDPAQRPDAEAVIDRLRMAGFEAGPAPIRYVQQTDHFDDRLLRPDLTVGRRQTTGASVGTDSLRPAPAGLQPRTVGIALAGLLLALLAVIFLLPKSVTPVPSGSPGDLATDRPASTPVSPEVPASLPDRDSRVRARAATEAVLGQLLAKVQTLEGRAVARWGGLDWRQTQQAYQDGDDSYLQQDYAGATRHYEQALERIEPLLKRVDQVFADTLADAAVAFDNGDAAQAVRLYELAVAISPGHAGAKAGLERARNLDQVLALTQAGLVLEKDLELHSARDNFARAVALDPQWAAATEGLRRVEALITQMDFNARMTEGLNALNSQDYLGARAAFRRAQELQPSSTEPADGLLQVGQALRLNSIRELEQQARVFEKSEQWQAAEEAYGEILKLDDSLVFARDGLLRTRKMLALHAQIDAYIEDPDSLSQTRKMQAATQLVVDITRMGDIGPRLVSARDELSRLIKRAATPLTVQIVSDEYTDVSIYKVARLGSFSEKELELRPGTYVAVGIRPGYRDVRLEFRVAPEIDMQPVVVRCEEKI